MKRKVSLVVLATSLLATGCRGAPPAPPPLPCPAPPPPPPALTLPTSDAVVRWSHDILLAFDRGDTSALEAALSAGYSHFEGSGAPTTREKELEGIAKRKPDAPQIARRSWSHETVSVHEPYAVFVGEAAEHSGGNDSHGGYDYDGWYSLVWCREGESWKLALFGWQRGGVGAQRDVWNEIFRHGTGYNHDPNQLLVDTIVKRKPGTALDIAMGQGRNALYLAAHGWKVTGVDFSDEAVRAAHDAAAEKHLPLDAVNADLDAYDFGVAKWDLVTMIYVPKKPAWLEKAKKSMKKGGLFVLEYFHDDKDAETYARGELAGVFKDGFDILRDEIVETRPDWGVDHASIVRFVARKR